MFIRRISTRPRSDGEHVCSLRLVRSERDGDKVRQRTLLSLVRHFHVESDEWPILCQRIGSILSGQLSLASECSRQLEVTEAEPPQQVLYNALGINPDTGGMSKTLVSFDGSTLLHYSPA